MSAVLLALVAALASALLTWLAIAWAHAARMHDEPGARRMHVEPTVRGAGIGFVAVIVSGWGAWGIALGWAVPLGRWAIGERFRTVNNDRAILLAHYDDGYRKVNGEWLFTRRFLQPHYRGPADLSADFSNDRAGLEARGVAPDV